MVIWIWVNIGIGNGLLPDDTQPSSEVLINIIHKSLDITQSFNKANLRDLKAATGL